MWYSPVMARTRRKNYTPKARLVSEHFLPGGKPKRRFESRANAKAFLVTKGWVAQYHVYQCTFCLGHHIAKN